MQFLSLPMLGGFASKDEERQGITGSTRSVMAPQAAGGKARFGVPLHRVGLLPVPGLLREICGSNKGSGMEG